MDASPKPAAVSARSVALALAATVAAAGGVGIILTRLPKNEPMPAVASAVPGPAQAVDQAAPAAPAAPAQDQAAAPAESPLPVYERGTAAPKVSAAYGGASDLADGEGLAAVDAPKAAAPAPPAPGRRAFAPPRLNALPNMSGYLTEQPKSQAFYGAPAAGQPARAPAVAQAPAPAPKLAPRPPAPAPAQAAQDQAALQAAAAMQRAIATAMTTAAQDHDVKLLAVGRGTVIAPAADGGHSTKGEYFGIKWQDADHQPLDGEIDVTVDGQPRGRVPVAQDGPWKKADIYVENTKVRHTIVATIARSNAQTVQVTVANDGQTWNECPNFHVEPIEGSFNGGAGDSPKKTKVGNGGKSWHDVGDVLDWTVMFYLWDQ